MRDLNALNKYRDTRPEARVFAGMGRYEGVFFIPNTEGPDFKIIASTGMGWDHVSVSLPDRCPTWEEMDKLKRMFFKDNEVAFQLHVTEKDHISYHPFCLHMWRPQHQSIPKPPSELVGPKTNSGE